MLASVFIKNDPPKKKNISPNNKDKSVTTNCSFTNSYEIVNKHNVPPLKLFPPPSPIMLCCVDESWITSRLQ